VAKASGLGDDFYVAGYHIGGDIQQLAISGPMSPLDMTDITQSAVSRQGGQRDGLMDITSYHDTAVLKSHVAFSGLPVTDVHMAYLRGTTLGNPAACMVAKQVGYDPTRDQAGNLTFKVQGMGSALGLDWGVQLTAGLRTDTSATAGTSVDTLASAAHGGQAYLQVTAFSGTDVTVKIQDSADNSSFSDVTSFAFAQTTTAPGAQRIAIADGATIRRYVKVTTVTSAGFTSVSFVVVMNKNKTSVVF
jgi:hypothetical protein